MAEPGMEIELDIRDSEVDAFLRGLMSDQLPFATSLAINRTAMDFQGLQRNHMAAAFTIRRKGFMRRSVKIRRQDFATKSKPFAIVRIESPGGRSDIFGKFETERRKRASDGGSLAIPGEDVPRTGAGIVRKRWRPRRLMEATEKGVRSERGRTFRGGQGRAAHLSPGIYTRTNDGGLKLLYSLRREVPIEPVLNFVANAERAVRVNWARNFTWAFDRAIGVRDAFGNRPSAPTAPLALGPSGPASFTLMGG